MALVGRLVGASDLSVTATVPAPMPIGAPSITSIPNNSSTIEAETIVSGLCPVIIPAIIVAIYDGDVLVGSSQCTAAGRFSLPVSLSIGTHTLVAIVVTITGERGESSATVTVTRHQVGTTTLNAGALPTTPFAGIEDPLRIAMSDTYAYCRIGADGDVAWLGSFVGGAAPYAVVIDWGDGSIDSLNISDQTDQAFSHRYSRQHSYEISVTVTDSKGARASLSTIAVSFLSPSGIAMIENNLITPHSSPIVVFIQQYIWQIYIGTLFVLAYLWYLERGRHLPGVALRIARRKLEGPRRHHR